MPLSAPRTEFGIHQMTALSRTTGLPYGKIEVLGNFSAENTREFIDLYGGSNPNIIDSENGNVTGDVSITVKEFRSFLYTLAGYDVSAIASNSDGEVSSALANKYGTSVYSATTGIATATVKSGSEADVKDGKYIVKAVTSTTVDVYAVFDNEFQVGTDLTYQDDTMKITASPLTITTSSAVEIPGTGIELTGGSGTIALTVGDTAVFETRSPNSGGFEASYGPSPDPIEFECYMTSQTKSNGEFVVEHFPRVKFASVPAGMSEKEWHEAEVTLKVLYDSDLGYSRKKVDITK